MDWMVFKNPSCATWTMRFGEEGDVCWLASRAMREELAHVLGRGVARAWAPSLDGVWSAWERYAITVPVQSTCVSAHRIRCRDADDQKFIDLALAHGVRWLVSRDKALLALKRRLRPLGLEVLTPDAWNAATA
jgi:predicted nucleic acid-binding protein